MTDDQITALAREYAEECCPIEAYEKAELIDPYKEEVFERKADILATQIEFEQFLEWLLRRFCLVEKWIDPKNKLPEIRERVLICEKVANQHKAFIGKRVPSPCTDGWEWNRSTKESVVAWMPLPKFFPGIAKEVEG